MSKEPRLDEAKKKAPRAIDLEKGLSEIESGSNEIGVFVRQQSKAEYAQSNKSSIKRRFVMSSVLIALCCTVIIGISVFAVWHQKPDKIVADALLGALQSKTLKASGDYALTHESIRMQGTYTLQTSHETGFLTETDSKVRLPDVETLEINSSFIGVPSGDIYAKFSNVQALYNVLIGRLVDSLYENSSAVGQVDNRDSIHQQFTDMYAPVIKKIDGQWVVVAAGSLSSVNTGLEADRTCLQGVLSKVSSDRRAMAEVRRIYTEYPFMHITEELGEENGVIGYAATLDNNAGKKFLKEFSRTEVYGEGNGCSDTNVTALLQDSDKSSIKNQEEPQIAMRVWVSKWQHQLKSLEITVVSGEGNSRTTASLQADISLHEPVSIEAPKNPLAIHEILPWLKGSRSGL